MKSIIKKHPLHLPIKESSVVHNDCANARIKNSIFKVSQLLLNVHNQFVHTLSVLLNFLTRLICDNSKLVNYSMKPEMAKKCALITFTNVWLFFIVVTLTNLPLSSQAQTQNFTISLSWNSGQTTTIDSVDGTSTYDDITATVEYNVGGFLYGSAEETGSADANFTSSFLQVEQIQITRISQLG